MVTPIRNNMFQNTSNVTNTDVMPAQVEVNQDSAPTEKSDGTQQNQNEAQASKRSPVDSKSQIAEHALGGQMQANLLHSKLPGTQMKERTLEGKLIQPPSIDGPKTKSPDPSARSMQKVLTDAGMKNVKDRPSDADLKTYYSTKAPSHEMIAKGNYKDAAAEYRKLANAETNVAEKGRLNTVATQLDMTQRMSDAKVKPLSFPPSEQNVKAYFGTMKDKDLPTIKKAYEDYANAFYVHSETKGVDKGDVVYSETKKTVGNTIYNSRTPEKWDEISDKREMHNDGRRIIDCEGYALMGQKCLQAAGFKDVKFAVSSRVDDPKTPENETVTRQHIMVSGNRTVKDANGDKRTEVAAITDQLFVTDTSEPNPKASDFQNLHSSNLVKAFRQTYREVVGPTTTFPGGLLVEDVEGWRAGFTLEDAIKTKAKQKAPTP